MQKRTKRVLVVDDEQIVRNVCSKSLSKIGCNVLEAENGIQALNYLQKGGVDLVFSDLKMPIMDGLELLETVKRDYPFVEVVIMTGYATIETAINAMKNGAYDFILKPVKPVQIRIVTEKCFEKIQLGQENKELRLAYQKLLDIQDMKNKFIAITSHELRTPVSHLKGYIGIMNDGIYKHLTKEEKQQCMRIILDAVRDLEGIVRDMHNLGQMENGQLNLQFERVELNELIEQLVRDYQLFAKQRDQELRVLTTDACLTVIADRNQIKGVVGELLQNAIKFTPDGGRIELSTKTEGDYGIISVRDNGIGIDSKEHGNIFEKFYEVQNSKYHSTSKLGFMGGGIGLGLPSVRAVAVAHGGGVKVKSEKDKGAEFLVYLPLEKHVEKGIH
ncbi:MAG: response regulator [bacterium]